MLFGFQKNEQTFSLLLKKIGITKKSCTAFGVSIDSDTYCTVIKSFESLIESFN